MTQQPSTHAHIQFQTQAQSEKFDVDKQDVDSIRDDHDPKRSLFTEEIAPQVLAQRYSTLVNSIVPRFASTTASSLSNQWDQTSEDKVAICCP
jgi:hypothetical protein